MTASALYASGIDASVYGEYRRSSAKPGLLDGRVTADGSSGYPAEAGRYHLYAGWFCPWSHRATIQIALNGLSEVITVSYVDGIRDARGWAFRERTGPDPVNGFTLLREAYEATRPDYDGLVSLPALWDRETGRILTNDARAIAHDVTTQFRRWASPAIDTYPVELRERIDEIGQAIDSEITRGFGRALYDSTAAQRVRAALGRFDTHLIGRKYLLGDDITDADIQLWVALVRYDAGVNAQRRIGPPITSYPNLWSYARDLYAVPAFGTTTNFAAFRAPLTPLPDWDKLTDRVTVSPTLELPQAQQLARVLEAAEHEIGPEPGQRLRGVPARTDQSAAQPERPSALQVARCVADDPALS
jgi:putative glutathione S-transferase